MSIRFIQPPRVKKAKAGNSQEVLQRIENYLNSGVCDEPVEILCGFWEDQQTAITYQELRQIVVDGTVSTEMLDTWRQDYSIMVSNSLRTMWENAIVGGSKGQPILDNLAFEFNTQTPGINRWIYERGASFVTACTNEQKEAIAALVSQKMRESHTVDELARLIRPCIGLTKGDAEANAKYYDNVVATLKKDHPRMKASSIRKKALEASRKYAERQHRQRAFTIAQTESAFAYNRGADEGVRQAQEQRLLGECIKRWSTSGDDAVCEICASLEGTEIRMDEEFEFKGRVLFPGHKMLPPAHPRCACAIEYIEIGPVRDFTMADYGAEEYPNIVEQALTDFDTLTGDYPPIPIMDIKGDYADDFLDYFGNIKGEHGKILNAVTDEITFAKTAAVGKIRISPDGIYTNLSNDVSNVMGPYFSTMHEIGHSVDRIFGRISDGVGMSKLIREDLQNYIDIQKSVTGMKEKEYLKFFANALCQGDAKETAIVSDLCSGVFGNKYDWPEIHEDSYWNKKKSRLGREAFAHFFGASCVLDAQRTETLEIIFPNAYNAYLEAIKEVAANV